jgi:hypothetical protein
MLILLMGLKGIENFSVTIQNALNNDSYDGGAMTDISVTGLIDSARIKKLRKMYSHEISENASRRISALLGTAFHKLAEENSPKEWITEERFYAEVSGLMLSGQIDAVVPVPVKDARKIDPNVGKKPVIIRDYKVITAYKAQSGMKDYERQGNIYAYLLRKNGFSPISFVIEAIIKDWKESFALRDENYPQLPIQDYEYPIWSFDQSEEYIKKRLELHFPKDDTIPECSDEEMWSTDPKWEAKKKGHTRATKLFDSEREALSWIADQDHRATKGTTYEDWDIKQRPVERKRCEANWCNVADFCDQFKTYKERLNGN